MGQTATEAAYRGGAEWLEGVKEVIWANYRHLRTELERNVPEITVCELEGTYLPMLDMRRLIDIRQGGVQMVHGRPVSGALFDFVQRRCRLAVDYGSWFGENFDGFIRLNLATTPENVRETVSRIVRESERLRRGEGQNM